MHIDRGVHLEVTDDALLVANGGRAFSRRGVISICASHLSDKRLSQSDDDVQDDFQCADADLVQGIRDRELDTYRRDRNRITSDYRGEDETRRDYGGRFLWELLQNADDAMGNDRPAGEFIGSKGLGFKAILEVTETPEVHSGPFHFLFSAAETQRLLKAEGLHNDPPPLTFRIPHPAPPNVRTKRLLDAGYTTVVRLPFKDDIARTTVVQKLQDLDPLFMLLVPQLSTLRIIGPNGETVHKAHSTGHGLFDGIVRLTAEGPAGSQSTCWRRWTWTRSQNGRRLTAAICLPLAKGDQGTPVAYSQTTPLFVFFPTQHDTKMRAVVHASFDLKQNRQYTRAGDYDDDIVEAFENLLRRVIDDVPTQTVLEAFAETAPDNEDINQHSDDLLPGDRLPRTTWHTVSTTRFVPTVGGLRRRPGEVRLWHHRLGFVLNEDVDEVRNARLLVPGLRRLWYRLCLFGAEALSTTEYIDLLRHCRNRSVNECVLSWMTLTRVLQRAKTRAAYPPNDLSADPFDDALQVPCWWTERGAARPLADGVTMLRRRPNTWPDWLKADVLHRNMRRAVAWHQDRTAEPQWWWSTHVLSTRAQYCDGALYPHLATWTRNDWRDRGWTALVQFQQWNRGSKDDTPWIDSSTPARDRRATAIAHLRIPTDKGWLPPADCYAGHAWGGLRAFDRFFATVPNRGLVLPLDQWPERARQETVEGDWTPLLRWLGVSWEPKARFVDDSLLVSRDSLPERWSNYQDEEGIRPTQWVSNLIIEHFPQCVCNSDAADMPERIVHAVIRLAKEVGKQRASYFYYRLRRCQTYAWYQLRTTDWLPCAQSLLHSGHTVVPARAFMPSTGFNGLLPEVLRSNDQEKWYAEVVPVLRQLDVREGLSADPKEWHHWMRQLWKVASDRVDPEHLRKAAEALYRGYLSLECGDTPFPSDIWLPCLEAGDDGLALTFASASTVYYVDEPHLQEVRDEIVQKGYRLFILPLRAGQRAVSRLGVSPLSSILRATVPPVEEDGRATSVVCLRYQQRRVGLTLAAKLEKELPQDLAISVVKDLQVVLMDRKPVAHVGVLSWQVDEDHPLLVNQRNRWRALGHGLARWVVRQESMAPLFETLLLERSRREYEDRLLHYGITKTDVERAMADWTDGSDGGQDVPRGSRERSGSNDSTGDTDDHKYNETGTGGVETQRTVEERASSDRSWVEPGEGGTGRASGSPRAGSSRRDSTDRDGSGREQRPNMATGRAAEDWLAERLGKIFGRLERGARDSRNRESDFIIRRGSVNSHIEVKHLASRGSKIYWSESQCSKARDISAESADRYFMALLIPDPYRQYQIYWSWDPLSQLRDTQREVQWTGAGDYELVESDSWDVSDQQPEDVPVKKCRFRILVDQVLLNELDEDDESLSKLRERILGV